MIFNKNKIIGDLLFLIISFLGLSIDDGFFSILLVILVYFYIGSLVRRESSVHVMFYIGYSTFIFFSCILNWYYLNISTWLFFVTSLVSAFFLKLTRSTKFKLFVDYGYPPRLIFVVTCSISSVLVISGFGNYASTLFPFLITLLSLSFVQNKIKNNAFFLFLFLLFFVVYILYGWSGFGRTVVVGWLMLSLIQFAYSINVNLNKYFLGLFPALSAALFSGRDFFQLKFTGFESALSDSAYGPYRLASSFLNDFYMRGYDFYGFFDQLIFTVFIYIPRSIWPSKPYGFGFEYTVRHLDENLVDAGHSVASTLIGEHIYYLGYLGIFTSLIVFFIIALITNSLYKIKDLNGNGVLIFSASMMVLVWGGMTSFAARVALSGIIFWIFFIFFRSFLTREIRMVEGRVN